MVKIGIVADDLTGATTVGVLLSRAGVSTAAFFDEDILVKDESYQAVIVNTDSRALSDEAAKKKVTKAVSALKEQGAVFFSKRIDTTLRGGIGFEIDAMLDVLSPDTIAIIVPAMPQSRRIVVGGYSIIDGVALSETPVSKDVRTPVTESYIPSLLKNQTKRKIGLIPLQAILSGPDVLENCLVEKRRKGAQILIVDAISVEDIRRVAEVIVSLEWNVLAVDPGPFTEQLVLTGNFGYEEQEYALVGFSEEMRTGTVLVVAGSATPVTKTQIGYLMGRKGVSSVSVSPKALIDWGSAASDEINRVVQESKALLEKGKPSVLILETAITQHSIKLDEVERNIGLKRGEAANRINKGLGKIVADLFSEKNAEFRGLYITGGDTMVNVLQALGARGIELIDYVIPQADIGKIIGGEHADLIVVGKGGLTGNENTAEVIVERIFAESARL